MYKMSISVTSLNEKEKIKTSWLLLFNHICITSHSADIKTQFGGTPLNSLSLITISLEWVHVLSSFLLKRILKYTVIKMHSASFFVNGWNGAYKVAKCVGYYILVEQNKTNNKTNERSMGSMGYMGSFMDMF